jgi:hypothetical protein
MSDDAPRPRVRAMVNTRGVDLIHNDLANAAFFFTTRINDRLAQDDREGLYHEVVAALTMTAFTLEAYLNFIGPQVKTDWSERDDVETKLKALGVETDYNKPPYATARELIAARNRLAHGKPQDTVRRTEAIGTNEELEALAQELVRAWERAVTPEFVLQAYDDVEAIWKELLTAAGIDVIDTLSSASGSLEVLSRAKAH